jgi:DNA-binding MarR family transcriptional regulator
VLKEAGMARASGVKPAAEPTEAEPDIDDKGADQNLDQGLLAGYVGPKVRLLWNLLSARMGNALAPFGLRPGCFSTMGLILANPGCSQNQLARALGLDKSAVVSLLDELESHGLAVRARAPNDRRRHALFLTKKGEEMVEQMRGPVSEAGGAMREELSAEEMNQLLTLLDRAYRALL